MAKSGYFRKGFLDKKGRKKERLWRRLFIAPVIIFSATIQCPCDSLYFTWQIVISYFFVASFLVAEYPLIDSETCARSSISHAFKDQRDSS